MRRIQSIVLIVAFIAEMVQSVGAQETRGSISGRTLDISGAVIIGAEVTATNKGTRVAINTVSNEQGNYRIDFLNPGSYEITASNAGFKTTQQVVELRTGDRLQIDMTLEVGEVTQTVEVTGQAPLLETTSGNRGQVIDNRRINNIPLAQGNPTTLFLLAPGANPGPGYDFKFDEPAWAGGYSSFQGVPPGTLGFTLNGVNNTLNNGGGLIATSQPPTEAVQEFRISQSYDAIQGHNSGTSIDLSLKSGTNDLHGAAYGFLRDSSLDANSFLDNRAGNPKPGSKFNRFGFAVNGPVYIPKVYNGRERTFFAYSYENTHQETLELIGTQTIPTAEELRGDFSKLLALGPEYQIYDPLTTVATGDGFYQRSPFPNNVIPEDRISPIAKKLAQYWPQPNLPGGPDGRSNFQPGTSSPTDWYQSFVRVDHTFSTNHRVFVHHGILSHFGQWKDFYNTLATGHRETIKNQNLGFDYVYVFSPQLLFDFRYGFTRFGTENWDKSNVRDSSGGFDITSLGLADSTIKQLDLSQSDLPHIFISDYNGIHDDYRRAVRGVTVHSATAQTDYNHGNHNLKMGFEFLGSLTNMADKRNAMPAYEFGNDFTNGPLNTSAAAPIGQGLAAFLLGQPTSGFIWRRDSFAAANPSYSFFVQDNWRITPKLTFNVGLRYEYYSPVSERFNRSVRGFDFTGSSPVEAQAREAYARSPIPELPVDQFWVRGGLLFAGVGGQPRELYDAPAKLLAPRFGFAYSFSNSSVLRGGYGVFFLPMGLTSSYPTAFSPILTGFSQRTDLIPSFDNGVHYVADLQNPFPDGVLSPPGNSLGLATNLGQSVSFFNTDGLKAPHVQRWSLGIQHMLPTNTLLEVGYAGSRGTKLIGSRDLDFLPAQYLSSLPFRDEATISFLTQAFPNPFAGLLPGTGLNTDFTDRSQLLRPFPQFQSVVLGQDNQGYSWYHSLEARIEKRFEKGYSYILAYTWSKNMEATERLNPSDPVPYRVISPIDRTHTFSLTGIWELPLGKGKPFGSAAPAVISKLISGWETSAVWHALSGSPLPFYGDVFINSNFQNPQLPESQRTVDRWFNIDAGFVRDPDQQPEFHLRTFPPRFSSLRTDGLNFWDLSLIKNTSVGEKAYIQFRVEFLNAFNHANFADVDTDPSSGSFGSVLYELTWPRRIQFGLKFNF